MYCPYCGHDLPGHVGRFCGTCGISIQFLAPFLQNDPGSMSDELMEAGLISKYFSEGHTYDVILDFLKTRHNIFLSLSTLKRKLKNAGLTRRTDYSPIETVNAVITHELTGSGQLLGYRALWQTLRQKYFLTVKRDDVMHAVRRLDPSGVQLRHRRRFIRRGYFTAGPNQVWHIDGTQFWIDLFNDLRERHLFNGSHEHKCLLRYVFLGILQKDLDEYRELWNNHTIRPVRQSSCHSGKPEAMYHLPHRFVFNPCNM
nr:uncharacterized protein LOC111860629 isoform X3 [Paramormyrops kingsleyae]